MDTETAADALRAYVNRLVDRGAITDADQAAILDLACTHACELSLQGVRIGEQRALRLGEGLLAVEAELRDLRASA